MDEIKKKNLKPDIVTYTSLIEAHTGGNPMNTENKCKPNMHTAAQIFADIRAHPSMKPSWMAVYILMRGYAKLNRIKAAEDVFTYFSEFGLKHPDTRAYIAMIRGFFFFPVIIFPR